MYRSLSAELKNELESLKRQDLYRLPEDVDSSNSRTIKVQGSALLNFSSNNYLGLAADPRLMKAACEAARVWGAGSGASRLLSGNLKIHSELELKLARFKNEEAVLVFSSGYLANLGAVTSFLSERDLVILDRNSHASLVDAARLSKAKLWVYPHNDVEALGKILSRAKGFRRKMVLTEAYFSMDGDIAPLDKILETCHQGGALLMVDEAHSTGVFGKKGGGLTEHFNLQGKVDIVMGTLSKALGSVGGYVAGSVLLKKYLTNRCRHFIYTTAPAPSASAAAAAALQIILKEPELRERLWANVNFLRKGLEILGFDLMGSAGPIIPIHVGETKKCLELRDFLKTKGIFAPAIRPPTVPRKTDRLRISISAAHQKEDLEKLLEVLKTARRKRL